VFLAVTLSENYLSTIEARAAILNISLFQKLIIRK
jgi:hypothetical protein